MKFRTVHGSSSCVASFLEKNWIKSQTNRRDGVGAEMCVSACLFDHVDTSRCSVSGPPAFSAYHTPCQWHIIAYWMWFADGDPIKYDAVQRYCVYNREKNPDERLRHYRYIELQANEQYDLDSKIVIEALPCSIL